MHQLRFICFFLATTALVCGCNTRRHVDWSVAHTPVCLAQSNAPRLGMSIPTAADFPGAAQGFQKRDNWFVDAEGRYALFRGVNIGSQSKKGPFYLPIRIQDYRDFNGELGRLSPCLDAMKSLGFNIVRLLVTWKSLEPIPDFNLVEKQLNALDAFVDALYERGMFVIVDFHQDIASDLYGGDGFPDWALAVDPEHPLPEQPVHPSSNWYLRYADFCPSVANLFDWRWPWKQPLNKSVRYSEYCFWHNRTDNQLWHLTAYPVQSNFLSILSQAANHWNKNPAILGYEPFNEPNDVGMTRSDFEENYLTPFYTNAYAAIHVRDTNSFLFLEPRTDWNIIPTDANESGLNIVTHADQIHTFLGENAGESFLKPQNTNSATAVFSFHFYDPWTVLHSKFWLGDCMKNKEKSWPPMFQTMISAATNRNLIPFLTEFGAQNDWRTHGTPLKPGTYDTQDRAYLDLTFEQIEHYFLNATIWCYDFYADSASQLDDWNAENLSILSTTFSNTWSVHNADIIARPYPMRSSAKPASFSYDLQLKQMSLVLQGRPVSAPTIIFVPRDIVYTNGFEVAATSRDLLWDDQKEVLYWSPDIAAQTNQIIIRPPGGLNHGQPSLSTATNRMCFLPR